MTQVSAKHILVQTQEEVQNLAQQIKDGAISFEDAAKAHSKCPSGHNNGELGQFGLGMMVKPFEDAAFALEIGGVSEPIQTQFGWHLIYRYA